MHKTSGRTLYGSGKKLTQDFQLKLTVDKLDAGLPGTGVTAAHARADVSYPGTPCAAILGLIPVTMPELLRQLRGTAIPEPRRDAWTLWRRRHQYHSQLDHQRWHAYADELPQQ